MRSRTEGGVQIKQASPSSGDYDAGAQYNTALDVLRDLANQEYARAERVSAKARQVFAFVTGFFGVTQVAALSTFGDVSSDERLATVIVAIFALVTVVVTSIFALRADALRGFRNLASDDVLDSVNEAISSGAPASFDLSQLYATALDQRRTAVEKRTPWLTWAQVAGAVAVVLLGAELILALAVRI